MTIPSLRQTIIEDEEKYLSKKTIRYLIDVIRIHKHKVRKFCDMSNLLYVYSKEGDLNSTHACKNCEFKPICRRQVLWKHGMSRATVDEVLK